MRPKPSQLIMILSCLAVSVFVAAQDSSFECVKTRVFSDPYDELPQYGVSKGKFGPAGNRSDNRLLTAATRTLRDPTDFAKFDHGQKLFQPNGICFSGHWLIDKPSSYSGLFAPGTKVPVIVRASVMLSGTTRSDQRALGLAIKLFVRGDTHSVNVLVMESMGGKHLKHITDAVLDNQPGLGNIPKLANLGVLLRIRKDLQRAMKEADTNGIKLRYLPLDHIAAATVAAGGEINAPHWIRFHVAPETPRVEADDFRDELSLRHYPLHKLRYIISVAPQNAEGKRHAAWSEIGYIELAEDVISKSCDTKLHFKHHGAVLD